MIGTSLGRQELVSEFRRLGVNVENLDKAESRLSQAPKYGTYTRLLRAGNDITGRFTGYLQVQCEDDTVVAEFHKVRYQWKRQ